MNLPELKNPFTSARIIGERMDPKAWHQQTVKRGDPAYVMSRGELVAFALCPAKWIQAEGRAKVTGEMKWGDLLDCMILTPEQFEERFAVSPETYPSAKGEEKPWTFQAGYCKDWRAEAEKAGKVVIKSDVHNSIRTAASKLLEDSDVRHILAGSKRQVGMEGEAHGIKVRGLIDLLPDDPMGGSIIDLKTIANDCTARGWAHHCNDFALDVQAALYLDLYNAATGEERIEFRHIIQEQEPPYHIELRMMSQEFIEAGRRKYISALRLYEACLGSNEWPGYDNQGAMCFGRWKITEPLPYML